MLFKGLEFQIHSGEEPVRHHRLRALRNSFHFSRDVGQCVRPERCTRTRQLVREFGEPAPILCYNGLPNILDQRGNVRAEQVHHLL